MKGRKWGVHLGTLLYRLVYKLISSFFSKRDKAVIISNARIEDNAIEMANFLALNDDMEIEVLVPKANVSFAKRVLDPRIAVYQCPRHFPLNWRDVKRIATAKYVFLTYQFLPDRGAKKQVFVNLWHGLTYKKIQNLRPYDGLPAQANFTVAGSAMTKKMNAEIFDVPLQCVIETGLPRNDLMLRSQQKQIEIKSKLPQEFADYSKLLIWMPTYRRSTTENSIEIRQKNEGLFGVDEFASKEFNDILKANNTLCLVKAHHSVGSLEGKSFDHIITINDEWLQKRDLLLYQLLACTDALISDYSSVMIDYMLLNKPIFCFAADLKAYKKSQGLCFSAYENWIPSMLYQDKSEFFKALKVYLETEEDSGKSKRKELLPEFFSHTDPNSARRIADIVF